MAKTPPKEEPMGVSLAPVTEIDGDRIDSAIAAIIVRDPLAETRHVNMMRIMTAMGVAIPILAAFLAWFSIQPVNVIFISSSSNGTNVKLQALGSPINTNAEIINWVTNSVVQAYTMSFANPEASLEVARPNFTASGWVGFKKALNDSGNMDSIVDSRYFTTAIPNAAAVLKSSSASADGGTTWKFQIPILVTYQTPSSKATKNYLVTVEVVRQPVWENVRGLGITSLLAQ